MLNLMKVIGKLRKYAKCISLLSIFLRLCADNENTHKRRDTLSLSIANGERKKANQLSVGHHALT